MSWYKSASHPNATFRDVKTHKFPDGAYSISFYMDQLDPITNKLQSFRFVHTGKPAYLKRLLNERYGRALTQYVFI